MAATPEFTNHELLSAYDDALAVLSFEQGRLGRLEAEIMRRIREAGATGLPDDVFDCGVETRYEYDQGRLQPLLEVLSTTELAAAYTAAHEEVKNVAARWDVRKLLPLARLYGDSVSKVVEDARYVASQKLRFKRKE